MLDERRSAGHAATRERPRPRRQFRELKRFDEVIVGTGIEPAHAIAYAVERGKQKHRQPRVTRAQALEHFKTGKLGQADVEDQQVELMAAKSSVGFAAVLGPVDSVARLTEGALQPVRERRIVFRDQDTHRLPPCAPDLTRHGTSLAREGTT